MSETAPNSCGTSPEARIFCHWAAARLLEKTVHTGEVATDLPVAEQVTSDMLAQEGRQWRARRIPYCETCPLVA